MSDMTTPLLLSNSLALVHSDHVTEIYVCCVRTIYLSEGVGQPTPRFRAGPALAGTSPGV